MTARTRLLFDAVPLSVERCAPMVLPEIVMGGATAAVWRREQFGDG